MQKALFIVIAVGLGIGFLIPTGPSEAPQTEAAPADAAPVEAAPKARPSPSTSGSWGGEARLTRRGNGHFYGNAMVNGQPVEMIIDTGASSVALTTRDAKKLNIPFSPGEFDYVGEGASGAVRGKFVRLDSVEIDGKKVDNVKAVILEGSTLSLLGQSYLTRMGEVQMKGEYMILR